MGPDDVRQCLEFVREWNTNAKTCYAAQAMLQALLRHHPPEVRREKGGEGLFASQRQPRAAFSAQLRDSLLCLRALHSLPCLPACAV